MKYPSLTFSAAAALATLFASSSPASAQSILKTAGNYSVLASQGITVAGAAATFKNGDIGLFPAATSNITGFPPGTVSGTTLLGTAATIISTGGAAQQAFKRTSRWPPRVWPRWRNRELIRTSTWADLGPRRRRLSMERGGEPDRSARPRRPGKK